jgi:iron complex outermembrane receptor protein
VPVWKDKVFASLEWILESKRTSVYEDSSGNLVSGLNAPGYGLLNLTLFSQNLAPGLEVSASVYNLLDHKYSDPSPYYTQLDLIEQDGRSFRLKVTYHF